jgi:hypothetical protein
VAVRGTRAAGGDARGRFLSGRSQNDSATNITAFRRGLSEVALFDGQNVEVDFRWALGHYLGKRKPRGCAPIRAGADGYFAVMVVGLPSSPTKTTRTLAGTLPLLNSWCW